MPLERVTRFIKSPLLNKINSVNLFLARAITQRVRVKRESFFFQGIAQPLFRLFPLFVCVAGYFRFQDLKSLFLVALFASFCFTVVVMVSEAGRWKSWFTSKYA